MTKPSETQLRAGYGVSLRYRRLRSRLRRVETLLGDLRALEPHYSAGLWVAAEHLGFAANHLRAELEAVGKRDAESRPNPQAELDAAREEIARLRRELESAPHQDRADKEGASHG